MKLFDLATSPEQYSNGEATSWMVDAVRQRVQNKLYWNAIKAHIPAHCRSVLDIGCGSSWVVDRLSEIGVRDYVGLEPSSKNFEIACQEHPEFNILQTTLESYTPTQPFDCVLALMVMGHIANVDRALHAIHSLLNVGGVCIIALSRFHPPEQRQVRNGRKYEVEEIDPEQYVDRSIDGTGYGIVDINRSPAYYSRLAIKNGFLVEQTEFADPGYSSKLLFILKKATAR